MNLIDKHYPPVPDFQLDPSQQSALDAIYDWLADDAGEQIFVLAGLAGTGKTTVMRHLGRELILRAVAAVFLAPTNKAAAVLRSKGVEARTIHSTFYRPVEQDGADAPPVFEFFPDVVRSLDLVVIDEASMVDSDIMDDLRSTGVPILLVGDHGQLPPVKGDPKLMRNPTVVLSQIHRQGDGNPIIDFAHHVREGHSPFDYEFTTPDLQIYRSSMPAVPEVDVWLCWTNATRIGLNASMLQALGGRPPQIQVQLRSNIPHAGIYNGEVYTVDVVSWGVQGMPEEVRFPSGFRTKCHPGQWNRPQPLPFRSDSRAHLDYGWAITVHSSQGSEWGRVAVIDEAPFEHAERWRYTAATRASKQLYWIALEALPRA